MKKVLLAGVGVMMGALLPLAAAAAESTTADPGHGKSCKTDVAADPGHSKSCKSCKSGKSNKYNCGNNTNVPATGIVGGGLALTAGMGYVIYRQRKIGSSEFVSV